MTEPTLAVIVERIDNLSKAMKDGFKGVHIRQDKQNGKSQKNTEWRLKNSKPMSMLSNVITIVITAVVVGGVALILK